MSTKQPAPKADTEQPDPDDPSRAERGPVIGDFGQDDAFATESHPEGLRYGERPHEPGSEYHGPKGGAEKTPHKDGDNSIG